MRKLMHLIALPSKAKRLHQGQSPYSLMETQVYGNSSTHLFLLFSPLS